jgi:hypothetical protein
VAAKLKECKKGVSQTVLYSQEGVVVKLTAAASLGQRARKRRGTNIPEGMIVRWLRAFAQERGE